MRAAKSGTSPEFVMPGLVPGIHDLKQSHWKRRGWPGHPAKALFWLSDEAWAAIEPHLPRNQPGARRVDDRRVISGILHVTSHTVRSMIIM
jgi:hypothetical protein